MSAGADHPSEHTDVTCYAGRGYDEDFRAHKEASMMSCLSTETHHQVQTIVQNATSRTTELERFLQEEDNVYAWGVRREDDRIVKEMTSGDYFLLRGEGTTRHNRTFEFLQPIDITWMGGLPQDRMEAARAIWDDKRYNLMWFSRTREKLSVPEKKLNELLSSDNKSAESFDFIGYMDGRGRYSAIRQFDDPVLQIYDSINDFFDDLRDC